ncbi:MAG: deoxyribonuclease IV [Chloroflexi bacterium CFX7]|nr:deoxyribonuclease IV [Chloroflexi bacterium CFX7]MCK6564834.1 deoxyribonuclease IV [Dehalococcoidia bacterium]
MRIGAHVSSAGGPANVFPLAAKIGAEAVQLFISAPQQWRPPSISDEQVAEFQAARQAASVPVFFHGVYLVNLASDDSALLGRSVGSLKQYLKWGETLGTVGTIFHVGSHKGAGFETVLPQVCTKIKEVLDYPAGDQLLIIENNAGQGGGVGITFSEIGAIIRGADGHPRLRVCLDTCHAYAMGYDLATREGCELAMAEFEREIGFDRLAAVHANDSKIPLGGMRDRHENIGEGHIGYAGFREIMRHPAFRDVPFLLEVPGIEGGGPDEENVNRLKAIREELGIPAPGPAAATPA